MTDDLPEGWSKVRVGDVCEPVSQRGPSRERDSFRYIDLGAIDNKAKRIFETTRVPFSDAPSRAKQILRAGDIVFSTVRVYLENIAQVPAELDGEIASTAFCVLRPATGIDSRYLYYYVTSRPFVLAVNQLQRGNSPPSVQDGDIRNQPFPLAPPQAQRRIASRIDELFSEIDEGERALERVQKLVERYRQSVLKAAVTGELTRNWRQKRKAKAGESLETGEALLARILEARREAWEKSELGKMEAKGIRPANDCWKDAYKTPGTIGTDYLEEIPDEWQRVRIDVAGEVQLGRQRSPAHHSGVHMRPYLRVANVHQERIDVSDVMSMNFTPEEFSTYSLQPGDILLNEGQSMELIGRPAMYGGEIPGACFTNTLVRFRSTSAICNNFALIVFLHYMKSGCFQKIAKITTNIAHLGAGRFAEMAFPVPSLAEQNEIVDKVNLQSSVYSKLISEVAERRQHVTALRQAVLKHAFSGLLVESDPSDETASVLLQRSEG